MSGQPNRITAIEAAIVAYTRGGCSRDRAEQLLLSAGIDPAWAKQLLDTADKLVTSVQNITQAPR